MIDVPRISVREARAHLADVVDKAERDQPTVILRRNKPVAAVVPLDVLKHYLELEEREISRIVDERTKAQSSDRAVPLEDVLSETASRAR
ncbi:type II toxin-antitoxin system Phd/YefM family antitoxin [Kineosporia babensis]|uniref:Antitoxin n=1 Tax=Kineosporia babensis TaxID=499548 RepID=A0A9X1NLD5_9ACTN|nr:type II toxin-antitoxin system Phd/YefM family antitoxin [Kineosporia babensis]MCD5315261.1 type II toxin-antitoxin system Phd/YefM family antitoxin [Kineosporia babensis]